MKSKFIIISIILLIVANIAIIYFKTYEGFTEPTLTPITSTTSTTPTTPTTPTVPDIKNAVTAARLAMNDNTSAYNSFQTANQKLESDRNAANAAKQKFDTTIKDDIIEVKKRKQDYNAKNDNSIKAAFKAIDILKSAPAPIMSGLAPK